MRIKKIVRSNTRRVPAAALGFESSLAKTNNDIYSYRKTQRK